MTEKKIFRRSKSFYIVGGIIILLLAAGLIFWNNFKYKLADKKTGQTGNHQVKRIVPG